MKATQDTTVLDSALSIYSGEVRMSSWTFLTKKGRCALSILPVFLTLLLILGKADCQPIWFPVPPVLDDPSYDNDETVYPVAAAMFYRNTREPFRYATLGGTRPRFRANINFEQEPIEVALLIRGSDGKYYSNAHSRFRQADGWILALATEGFSLEELRQIDNIRAERSIPSRVLRNRRWIVLRVQLDIQWYRLEKTEVDREGDITPRKSPPPNYTDREGRSVIRYYLARIRREGTGWADTYTLRDGGIIAPVVSIRWEMDNQVHFMWLPIPNWGPYINWWAPMPGMNDCLGLRAGGSGSCQGSISQPIPNMTYNQHYGQRGHPNWQYPEEIRKIVPWFTGFPSIGYPCQYPIFVFRNIGARTTNGGHSMFGIHSNAPTYSIPYDSARWWRIHRATLYLIAPYEWGGKYYTAEASGRIFSWYPNGTNHGFGLDCSGLIAVANGYVNATHYGTGQIAEATYGIGWDQVIPGDVLLRHNDPQRRGNHVMLVTKVYLEGPGGPARYECIEAAGAGAAIVERVRIIGGEKSIFDSDGFRPRRFIGE